MLQDLPRITLAIEDGDLLFGNPVLVAAARHAVEQGTQLHLLALVGPGGVHAVDGHILAMVQLAALAGLPPSRIRLHAITDGRDTAPRSAAEILPALEAGLARATIATVSGRFYAMDRDGRWDRVALAWEAIVHGSGETASSAAEAVARAYARGKSDEFIRPTVIGRLPGDGGSRRGRAPQLPGRSRPAADPERWPSTFSMNSIEAGVPRACTSPR